MGQSIKFLRWSLCPDIFRHASPAPKVAREGWGCLENLAQFSTDGGSAGVLFFCPDGGGALGSSIGDALTNHSTFDR